MHAEEVSFLTNVASASAFGQLLGTLDFCRHHRNIASLLLYAELRVLQPPDYLFKDLVAAGRLRDDSPDRGDKTI